MGYWLKLYTDILDDPKYFKLSDNAKLGMYEIFLVAKKIETDETTGDLPTVEDVAFHTRRSIEWWNETMAELETLGIVIIEKDKPKIRKFAERQAKIPDSERVRQYRKRNNANMFKDGNDSVTIRDGEKIRVREDKEKEIEKEKEPLSLSASEFFEFSEMQYEELKKIANKTPNTNVNAYLKWAALKGMTAGEAIIGARAALPHWKDGLPPGINSNPERQVEYYTERYSGKKAKDD